MFLTLRYCCAYSARCSWGNGTWGAAPGSILLRLQRVLIAGALPPHPKSPWIFLRPSLETKRPNSTLLKMAPSSLMTASGNVIFGFHELGNGSHYLGVAFHLCACYLFTFPSAFYFFTLLLFTFQNCLFAFLSFYFSINSGSHYWIKILGHLLCTICGLHYLCRDNPTQRL